MNVIKWYSKYLFKYIDHCISLFNLWTIKRIHHVIQMRSLKFVMENEKHLWRVGLTKIDLCYGGSSIFNRAATLLVFGQKMDHFFCILGSEFYSSSIWLCRDGGTCGCTPFGIVFIPLRLDCSKWDSLPSLGW